MKIKEGHVELHRVPVLPPLPHAIPRANHCDPTRPYPTLLANPNGHYARQHSDITARPDSTPGPICCIHLHILGRTAAKANGAKGEGGPVQR
jgi:hypothetical protein